MDFVVLNTLSGFLKTYLWQISRILNNLSIKIKLYLKIILEPENFQKGAKKTFEGRRVVHPFWDENDEKC